MKSAYIDKIISAEEQAEQIVELSKKQAQDFVAKKSEQLQREREDFVLQDKKRYLTQLDNLEIKYNEQFDEKLQKKRQELMELSQGKEEAIADIVRKVVQEVQDGYC
ncbi:MAG: hypothetical protein ACI4L7_03785 [Christensenellales bacterium]